MVGGTFGPLMAFLAASLQFYLDRTGNILINPGFEQPLGSAWTCRGCIARLVNDSQSGNMSLLATGRYQTWQGPHQILQPDSGISGGHIYRFTGYAKVLPTLPDQEPQNLHTMLYYTKPDTSIEWVYISHNHDVEVADGWVLMEAEFYTWELNQTELSLTIRDPDSGVDFLVDSLSIVEVGDAVPESAVEVLRNPGFENPIGGSSWYCRGRCSETLVNDSHTGSKAYKASNRTDHWHGPLQILQPSSGIAAGRIYRFTGYVKLLLSLPDQEPQSFNTALYYELYDYSWELAYMAYAHDIVPDDGWVRMETEFYSWDVNQRSMEFAIRGPDGGVDFLVDSLSVVEIGEALLEPANQAFRNPGFENPIGGSGWFCYGRCTETRVDDSHTGSKAYKVSDRDSYEDSPAQHLWIGSRVLNGQSYQFSGYVKVLQSLFQQTPQSLRAAITYAGADGLESTIAIAYAHRISPEDGWVLMEAEFRIPDGVDTYVLFSINGPAAGIDFLVDTMSITEIA